MTTTLTTPPKPTTTPAPPPAAPELNPRPTPEKIVTLSSTKGVWEVELKLSDPSVIFSERDINMLIRFLQMKKAHLRQQAAIAHWKTTHSTSGVK